VNKELDILLAPGHGNAADLTHSALFKLSNGSEFGTITWKIKKQYLGFWRGYRERWWVPLVWLNKCLFL